MRTLTAPKLFTPEKDDANDEAKAANKNGQATAKGKSETKSDEGDRQGDGKDEPVSGDDDGSPPFDVDETLSTVSAGVLPEALTAILSPIVDCEISIREMTQREEQLTVELDEIRESLALSKEAKVEMLNALPNALVNVLDPDNGLPEVSPADSVPKPQATAESDESTDPPTARHSHDMGNEGWEKRPTDSICEGVVGLGVKKREALCDAYPTLGELNAVRVQSVDSRKHFATLLPKGIGKPTADELAERLMNAELGLTSSKSAAEQAEETAREKRVTGEVDAEPKLSPKKADKTESSEPDDAATEKHLRWCKTMVKSIRAELGGDDTTGVLDYQEDSETWDDGNAAFNANLPFTECPVELTQGFAADWLRGWIAAEVLEAEEIEKQTAEESAEAEAEPSEAEPAEAGVEPVESSQELNPNRTIDPADLAGVASEIEKSSDWKCRSATTQWNQGYEAGLADKSLDACPIDGFAYQVEDWLRGYYSAKAIDAEEL